MQAAINAFLMAMEADGLAPKTVRWYKDKLTQVIKILSNGDPPPIEEITLDDLRRVIVEVRRRGVSVYTVHGYVRTLKRFFSWHVAEGNLSESPADRLSKPSLPKDRPPKAISLSDVRKLLDAALTARDRALVLVLLDTGCRAGEVMGMKVSDVDLAQGVALVNGKGNKFRVVALNPMTVAAIREYLETERPTDQGPALWQGPKGPLTTSGLIQVLKRLAERAGVTGPVNPHSFRHGFAREYLKSGGDLSTLSRILGHADIQVTAMSYAIFTRDELLKQQRRLSPLHALEDQ